MLMGFQWLDRRSGHDTSLFYLFFVTLYLGFRWGRLLVGPHLAWTLLTTAGMSAGLLLGVFRICADQGQAKEFWLFIVTWAAAIYMGYEAGTRIRLAKEKEGGSQ